MGAMDLSVVVYHLEQPCPHLTFNQKKIPEIVSSLERLQEEKGLKYTHDFVKVSAVNTEGYYNAVQGLIEVLIPKHVWEHKLKECDFYRLSHTPPSLFYKVSPSNSLKHRELQIGHCITNVKRHWWATNVWHDLYPQYGWNENWGRANISHGRKVLLAGAMSPEHYLDFIMGIPSMWIQEVREHNLSVLTEADYLNDKEHNQAEWWCKLARQRHFLSHLPADTQLELGYLTAGHSPDPNFRYYLKKEIKKYVPNFNTAHLRATIPKSLLAPTPRLPADKAISEN